MKKEKQWQIFYVNIQQIFIALICCFEVSIHTTAERWQALLLIFIYGKGAVFFENFLILKCSLFSYTSRHTKIHNRPEYRMGNMSDGGIFLPATARVPGVIKATVLIALILLTSTAQALTCTANMSSIAVRFPAAVTLPRDAVVGTMLTAWTASDTVFYNCQNADPSKWTGVGAWSTMDSNKTVTVDGINYAAFNTGLSGVSMIARVRPLRATDPAGASNIPAAPTSVVALSVTGGTAYPTLNIAVYLALVKTGDIVAGKVAAGTFGKAGAGQNNNSGANNNNSTYTLNQSPANVTFSAVNMLVGTCMTPNVIVDLGTHRRTEFSTRFSTTKPVDFNVVFKNCAVNIKKISMSLSRVGNSGFSQASGLFDVNDESTADGIVLKVMERSGSAITFDKFYPLADYDGAGGSVNFPLKAAMVKINTVTGGKVKGTLRFNILYQ